MRSFDVHGLQDAFFRLLSATWKRYGPRYLTFSRERDQGRVYAEILIHLAAYFLLQRLDFGLKPNIVR